MVARYMDIPFFVASFLGGTGLLIVVSVGLDFIQRIEANLLMRNYSGFLGSNDSNKPGRG
jgi:preprotein translocase subunit SecY